MEISKASTWVVIFSCDNATVKCGRREATNHSRSCPSVKFILASSILHFNLWSNSHGVLPNYIAISLNPTIDCASYLGLMNSLFRVVWMKVTTTCRLSFEYLMYQVSGWSYKVVINVTSFMRSPIMPWASHTALTTNQNFSKSSFPKPLNKGSFTEFAILNCGGGQGATGEVRGDGGEVGGGVRGGGIQGNPCLINWTTLHRETSAIPSSSPRRGEFNGLYSGTFFPSFL